jgi:hypothetical protein
MMRTGSPIMRGSNGGKLPARRYRYRHFQDQARWIYTATQCGRFRAGKRAPSPRSGVRRSPKMATLVPLGGPSRP